MQAQTPTIVHSQSFRKGVKPVLDSGTHRKLKKDPKATFLKRLEGFEPVLVKLLEPRLPKIPIL